MLCGKCGSLKAHRSRRRGIQDSVASLIRLVPYRCGACQTRFYARQLVEPSEAVEPEAAAPEIKPGKRRRPKGLVARLKEMMDVRREKRQRIGTQLFIYGLALMVFLAILYGITQGGIPGF